MIVGVLYPTRMPLSFRVYADHVTRELDGRDVRFIHFAETDPLRIEADVYWDPRAGGGHAPHPIFRSSDQPLVVTVHGAGPFVLSAREQYDRPFDMLAGKLENMRKLWRWRHYRARCAAIIAVSEYAKGEIQTHLGLPGEKIVPIYHGVDHSVFKPQPARQAQPPFLFHVSQQWRKKNLLRILSAYARLPLANKPRLVALVPGCPPMDVPEGAEILRDPVAHEAVASFYRGALGLMFPSLHETFGLPIVEAMACGCPVLTANSAACAEVAGDAALLVDPRSVEHIAAGMYRLSTDPRLREELRRKGIERAARFTWGKSAKAHGEVFRQAAGR